VNSPIGDYLAFSLLVLLVSVALGALFVYAARRAGLAPSRGHGSIELLARLPLEPRRSVYVVRVLDQVLIIGASEAGLAKLGELPETSAAALRREQPPSSFASVLEATLRRSPARTGKSGDPPPPTTPGGAP
jgi:flagellar biogenesis protein FliO